MKECSVQAHSQTKKRKKRPSASDSGSDDQDRPDHGDEADKDDVFAESSEKPAYLEFSLDDDAVRVSEADRRANTTTGSNRSVCQVLQRV